jgi:DNA invertase Pin-like site-specific DNA recombinase
MLGNPYPQGNYAEVFRYYRESTKGQDRLRQDGLHKPYLHIEGSVTTDEFHDSGFSGGDRDRPALKQLRAFLRVPQSTGHRRLIIVADLARLFRDLSGLLQFIEEHVYNGQCDLFIIGPIPLTLRGTELKTDVASYQMLVFAGMLAEIERMNISKRTRDTLAAKKALGHVLGRPRDTKMDNAIIDMHYAGKSMYATAKELRISYKRVKNAWDALGLNDGLGNSSDE